MEILDNAADGDFGAIIILLVVGLILLRFVLKILKFVIVQFPALFGGLVFGLVFAAEDGIDVDLVLENPALWDQLIPYVLPALAVGFVIWNIVLSILKAVFRSIFGQGKDTAAQTNASQKQPRNRQQPRDVDDVVTASEASAMRTRKRHMEEFEKRNQRIRQHELSHQDKDANLPIVRRRIRPNQTVTRRIKVV